MADADTKSQSSESNVKLSERAQDLPQLTCDTFHRGAFEVLQPLGSGHRSGSDALLLAAALPCAAQGMLADLGAGAGVAGLSALARNPGLQAVLVEIDPQMAEIARQTLELETNFELSSRARVLQMDVTLSGRNRENAGLKNHSFDHVIMNPPYNSQGKRASDDPMKALAHMMGAAGLEAWMRTAAAIIRPGGMLHLIYRSESLGEIIAAAQGRFGALTILPLHSTADKSAGRIILRAIRGSKAPLTILPGLVLHELDNSPTPVAVAALNGEAGIFPD